MRQTTLTGKVAPQDPRGRGIPQGCGHFVNSPHFQDYRGMQALWGKPWTARSVFVDENEVVPFRGIVTDLCLEEYRGVFVINEHFQ